MLLFFFFYSISKAPNHFHLLHKEIQSLLAKVTVPSPGIPFTVITGKKWLFILTTLIIIAQIRINSEKTENNNWVFDNFKFHSLFLKGGLMSDVRCDALKLCHSLTFGQLVTLAGTLLRGKTTFQTYRQLCLMYLPL